MNYLAIILLFLLSSVIVAREWKVRSRMHSRGEYLDTDDYIEPNCLSRVEIVQLFEKNKKNPILMEAVISGKCYVRSENDEITKAKCLSSKDISVLHQKYPDNTILLLASIKRMCVIKKQNNDSNVDLQTV